MENMTAFAEPGDHSYQGCFFAHRNPESVSQFGIFRYPCRINAYIAILCTEGSAEVILNMRRYTIRKNTLFVSLPNDIIQLETWNNCEFYAVALNDDFAKQMILDYKKVLSVLFEIQKQPCIEISQAMENSLEKTFRHLVKDMNLFKETDYYNEIVMNYISLAIYKACSVISRYLGSDSNKMNTITKRNEEYYNRFMELLYQHFKTEHHIGFYASAICITPKYLTSLIKKMTNRSATQWINEFVVMEAMHLLKYSKMSIQEISDYLSFPNQSFFAQYFKRQSGISPSKYRTQP